MTGGQPDDLGGLMWVAAMERLRAGGDWPAVDDAPRSRRQGMQYAARLEDGRRRRRSAPGAGRRAAATCETHERGGLGLRCHVVRVGLAGSKGEVYGWARLGWGEG
jgi:hypothetical protein